MYVLFVLALTNQRMIAELPAIRWYFLNYLFIYLLLAVQYVLYYKYNIISAR
jgi:hypothetical protein